MNVTFFGLIPRLPSLTSQEFHDHYRHPHGTLGLRTPGIRDYVQNHQFSTDLLDERQGEFEAVAEWQSDSAGLATGDGRVEYQRLHTGPDEANFVDSARLIWLYSHVSVTAENEAARSLTHADRIWDPAAAPFSIKALLFLSERDAAANSAERAGELAFMLGALRFEQCEPHPDVYDGTKAPAFAAVRQIWWPTLTVADRGIRGSRDAWRELTNVGEGSYALLTRAERFGTDTPPVRPA